MTTGRDVLLEVLRTEGVTHLFGNPGSTELPLIDALAGADDLQYVLALQEATVVGMADGYARATGRPAFLNLHTSAGLGNAMGNLTNARMEGTPLVVTAGQQDYRHIAADPLLAGDLTGIASAAVKWTHEVRTVGELGTILRRAFQDAASSPTGPVFVSLPMDVVDHETDAAVPPPSRIERRTVSAGIEELAYLLTGTDPGKLAIVVGDEVAASGAVEAVVAVAEALGARVYGSPLYGATVFPPAHPLWAGSLPPAAQAIRGALEGIERVFLVGGQAFLVYPYSPGSPLPDSTELLHLSPDPAQLGRAHPVRLGLVGDPKATLEAVLPRLRTLAHERVTAAVLEHARAEREAAIATLEETAQDRYGSVPMHPMAAAHALVRAVPDDTAVVDEAITTGGYVRGFHHTTRPNRYFFCRGGGLGWGMPAAVGVSLGCDREPVLSVVGDGSAMYSPQALWTAAREALPVVFAVVNNRQYRILKDNLRGMGGESVRHDRFVAMDLGDPPVDYVALARSMGVDATLVEKAGDVGDAVRAALEAGRPHLLELPISAP
jgi:benzoylformate decarboxylase